MQRMTFLRFLAAIALACLWIPSSATARDDAGAAEPQSPPAAQEESSEPSEPEQQPAQTPPSEGDADQGKSDAKPGEEDPAEKQPEEESPEKPAEAKPEEKPAEKPVEEPVEKSAEKPEEKSDDQKPTEEKSEKKSDAEKEPKEKSSEESNKQADEKPAAEEPGDDSQEPEESTPQSDDDPEAADEATKQEEAPPEPRGVEWDEEIEEVLSKSAPKTAKDLRLIQTQLQRVVKAANPATVAVRVGNAFGSGVIVSPDGVVLTAGHVVGQPNKEVTFIFPDGRTAKGKTLGMNQQIDSGMMKITDEGPWPFVEVAKSNQIKGGEWVVAIGQPGGFDGNRTPPVRLGRVLFANDSVINTDCTLVGGDSGGPLFNMRGQVVGIHSRIGRRITNNFHVPISTYHDTWDRLAAAESWGSRLVGKEPVRVWPMLGVTSKRKADRCELSQVYPGRPAATAGLKPGDVITKFAGKKVNSAEQLGKLLYEQRPLATVKVEVQRGEENLELKVRLGRTVRPIPGSYDPSEADKKAS